jgi:hypothetical protein
MAAAANETKANRLESHNSHAPIKPNTTANVSPNERSVGIRIGLSTLILVTLSIWACWHSIHAPATVIVRHFLAQRGAADIMNSSQFWRAMRIHS